MKQHEIVLSSEVSLLIQFVQALKIYFLWLKVLPQNNIAWPLFVFVSMFIWVSLEVTDLLSVI